MLPVTRKFRVGQNLNFLQCINTSVFCGRSDGSTIFVTRSRIDILSYIEYTRDYIRIEFRVSINADTNASFNMDIKITNN